MVSALELKQEGNQLYVKGKIEEAILKYKAAIEILLKDYDFTQRYVSVLENGGSSCPLINRHTVSSTCANLPPQTPIDSLESSLAKELGVLFSNASQAFLDLRRYDAAESSAARAVEFDPASLKAWVRRVKALTAIGSQFEAFIMYYVNIAPLLNNKGATKAEQQEAARIVADLSDVVGEAVGVSGAHAGLGLRRTSHAPPRKAAGGDNTLEEQQQKIQPDGGLSTVATMAISADSIIFTEKQFSHDKLSAMAPEEALTTESLIKHFSSQLISAIRAASVTDVEEAKRLWAYFASVMRGSWPRRLEEIGGELSAKFICELRLHHKDDIADGYIQDDCLDKESLVFSAEHSKVSNESRKEEEKGDCLVSKSPLPSCMTRGVDASTGSSGRLKPFSVTLSELTHLAVTCRYNCFHSGFFRACALANHSCNPNSAMKYVAAQKKVVMVAVRNIAPGEDITVKYLPDMEYILGVSRRRELLYRSWLFWCDCPRCDKDLFDKDHSTHEWIRCMKCNGGPGTQTSNTRIQDLLSADSTWTKPKLIPNGYAHLPITPVEMDEKDPSVAESSPCFNCGELVTISRKKSIEVMKTVEEFLNQIKDGSHATFSSIGVELLRAWRRAEEIVHEDHWAHRSQLYCYCLALGETIRGRFNYFATSPPAVARAEDALEMLESFGLADGRVAQTTLDARDGGDLLVALVELWRRIEPFYPPTQAYHLHMMIAQLVCLNLMLPERLMVKRLGGGRYLDPEVGAAILVRHTPFISQQDRGSLWRVVSQRKEADKGIVWAPKALKAIKKALS